MNSLQNRLLVGVTSVFVIGFVLAAIATYVFSQATMYSEFDEALFATAQALANLTEETAGGIEFELSEGFDEFRRDDAPSYYQFWLDGRTLARSSHLNQCDLQFAQGTLGSPKYAAITLPDGRHGRQISLTYHPPLDDWDEYEVELREEYSQIELGTVQPSPASAAASNETGGQEHAILAPSEAGVMTFMWERPRPNVTIAVARATTDIDRRLSNLLWILPSVGTAITLLSSIVLISVVRNGLKPVEAIASMITDIDENTLAARVPTGRVPLEISPIIRRLNDLLSRLENAFHRERAFSSNLAHELRTPLAGLRATLEVHRTQQHNERRCERTVATCLEICGQSETLVENLLSLARVEASTFARNMEQVQINELVRECWTSFVQKANERNLTSSFEVPHVSTSTDRELLRVILQNVFSNAVCHSEEGGHIDVAVVTTEHMLFITVTNTGNQLSPQQAELAFDHLWRGDDARSETGEHFGLGLTIIKRFAEALGGRVDLRVGTSFRIHITLPA